MLRQKSGINSLLLCAATALTLGAGLSACGGNSAPNISDSQAPAPGTQTGIRSITDTDYEQTALSIDTTQLTLADLARQPAQGAGTQVLAIANEAVTVLGPETVVLRKSLVTSGNAEGDAHNHAVIDDAAVNALSKKTGPAFDSAWARAMLVLNEQAIAAAVNELNYGEDTATRALARTKIDYASKQNAALKRIAGVG